MAKKKAAESDLDVGKIAERMMNLEAKAPTSLESIKQSARERGERDGEDWACNHAAAGDLQKLEARYLPKLRRYLIAEAVCCDVAAEVAKGTDRTGDYLTDDDMPEDEDDHAIFAAAYCDGFYNAAMHIWKQVRPRLKRASHKKSHGR